MSFRSRLLSVCAVLLGLVVVLVLGIVFSPDRVQARTSGRPLLPLATADEISGIEVDFEGTPSVTLARGPSGWKTTGDAGEYPASADRLHTFLRTLTGLSRGKMVSRDSAHFPELGVSDDTARHLILRRTAGRPDLELLVGKRGPSGDEDYVRVKGEGAAYLVRGSLAFFLSQERSYWYELHVLPDDVQGTTVARVSVRGPLAGAPYTLVRNGGAGSSQWSLEGKGPANGVVAGAMASALALLEGEDFARGTRPVPAGDQLDIEVTTLEGKTYALVVHRDPASRTLLVTTSWSPWTYVVNPVLLQRAVRPLAVLAAPA
jgi:hypothetical protein